MPSDFIAVETSSPLPTPVWSPDHAVPACFDRDVALSRLLGDGTSPALLDRQETPNIMRSSILVPAFTLAIAFTAVTFTRDARAADVEVTAAQFADAVESGKPVGDAKAGARLTYWLQVKNGASATSLTLVWSLDGKEAARQTLDVGTSSRWRTWGHMVPRDAKRIEVEILDAAGNSLKKDSLDRAGA